MAGYHIDEGSGTVLADFSERGHAGDLIAGTDQQLPSWISGQSTATITPTGALPATPFRCAVTLEPVAGHTDVVGDVVVGSETLSFTSATRKTTTVPLTAFPTIRTSGLDCNILIEAINSAGAPILKETLTNILVGFKATQKTYLDSEGNYTLCSAQAKTTDTACVAGTILRIDGIDYTIVQVEPKNKPSGREYMRKLLLKQ